MDVVAAFKYVVIQINHQEAVYLEIPGQNLS